MGDLNVQGILPLILIGGAALVAMMAAAVLKERSYGASGLLIALGGLIAAWILLWQTAPHAPAPATGLLYFDSVSVFFTGLMITGGFFTVLLSPDYLEQKRESRPEYYILLLSAILGAAVLAAANHFASFFLGLEILSVSLYALIAFLRGLPGIEAGIKYLILASVSSAFLLFGMALIFAESGTLVFSEILRGSVSRSILLTAGAALTLVGIGFKLGVVPFHMWTPDVYEGAPAPVTAFIATVSKGAVFAVLLRYFSRIDYESFPSLQIIIGTIAALSMFTGNLLALFQDNVKRILAYSSIAHLGYILVAFLAGGPIRAEAVAFYFAAYFITLLGAFGMVALLSREREADRIEDYYGLFRHRPFTAGVFSLMLLSLAGIPVTAGFMGKFLVIAAGAASSLWILVFLLVVNSAIGLYYYLRIVSVMFTRTAEAEPARLPLPIGGAVMIVLTAMLLWLGIYPEPLLRFVQQAAGRF